MNERDQLILECHKRMKALAATPAPPSWRTWDLDPWEEGQAHGPPYAAGAWFGKIDEAQRVRFLRALRMLASQGIIATYSRCGGRLTNIKLTDLGIQAAEAFHSQQLDTTEDLR
ncbi:MAG: hypothetical protein WCL32_24940 [Planctomycetota bacterium]